MKCLTSPGSRSCLIRYRDKAEEAHDYIDETSTVANAATYTWMHPLGDIISGLLRADMALDWLHEHDAVTWHMFDVLVPGR